MFIQVHSNTCWLKSPAHLFLFDFQCQYYYNVSEFSVSVCYWHFNSNAFQYSLWSFTISHSLTRGLNASWWGGFWFQQLSLIAYTAIMATWWDYPVVYGLSGIIEGICHQHFCHTVIVVQIAYSVFSSRWAMVIWSDFVGLHHPQTMFGATTLHKQLISLWYWLSQNFSLISLVMPGLNLLLSDFQDGCHGNHHENVVIAIPHKRLVILLCNCYYW